MAIVKSEGFDENTIGGAKREQLARDLWAKNEEVLDSNPSAKLILTLVWTPRPHDHPRGVPFDDTHTAIVTGNNKVTMDELEKFMGMAVTQLLNVARRVVDRDPSLVKLLEEKVDKMSKGN
jgi:hypothetical protein